MSALETIPNALVSRRPFPFDPAGEQIIARYRNGLGASIVRHSFSYGRQSGLWELAVLRFSGEGPYDYNLIYTTHIADDVIGDLTEEEAVEICAQIAALP